MPGQVFSFEPPDRFVLGTVGEPGERTFFLQARSGANVVSVALEKVQARVLAERLADLLDEVRRRGGDVPTAASPDVDDMAPLDIPIVEEFRVGTLALAWDGGDGNVVIEAQSIVEDEADESTADMLRVRISPGDARAFVDRALRVVAAGRPPCPLCGLPLDPTGHICPRLNGHRH